MLFCIQILKNYPTSKYGFLKNFATCEQWVHIYKTYCSLGCKTKILYLIVFLIQLSIFYYFFSLSSRTLPHKSTPYFFCLSPFSPHLFSSQCSPPPSASLTLILSRLPLFSTPPLLFFPPPSPFILSHLLLPLSPTFLTRSDHHRITPRNQ